MICDKCGKTFDFGNHPDGIPNGITLEFQNGGCLTLCAECIMDLDSPEGQEWLENWRDENEYQ